MKKLKDLIKESVWGKRQFGESLPTVADYKAEYDKKQAKLDSVKQHLDTNLKKVNETLPAFAKEWKGLDKAEKVYLKAVLQLSKSVGKVDKKSAKDVIGHWRALQTAMEKYKDTLSKKVLDKLQ
tara:strand:+ start:462 stop:833 length:372 start_codon:yes stop_codon:yes gene_type:complete